MIFISIASISMWGAAMAEPNPPQWPDSVSIFAPTMQNSDIEAVVNAAFATNGNNPRDGCCNGEFSDERFALMFLPGTYNNLDVPVGYYTSVYGMGVAPTDTVFTGSKGVFAEEACGMHDIGALSTFWRSAENFHSQANFVWEVGTGMSWVVSQAAPLRNVKVDNDLLHFEYINEFCCGAGYASGGWDSGVMVGGTTKFGSQQQYMMRNSQSATGTDTPSWSGVFVGVDGAPDARCGDNGESGNAPVGNVVNEKSVPLVAEKPYITSTDSGATFQLVVPAVKQNVGAGVAWTESGFEGAEFIDFSNVFVASTKDSAATINQKLSEGLHVVISPGIYHLEETITVRKPNQVVLGLGYATLVAPTDGTPCIIVGDVSGVRIAGVLLQAGAWKTSGAMLQVGESGNFKGSEANPVVLTDVFVRVGGPDTGVGPVGSMVLVQSGYTIIDNTWLWRADHLDGGAVVMNGDNAVTNGLIVNADNVFAYGLAVEHTNEDNVVWNGDNGVTYFFQAEIMYDYLDPIWDHSCYKIGANVTTHMGAGMGCYSYFRDAAVHAPMGIAAPDASNVQFNKAVNVFLSGNPDSGIDNLVNYDGNWVNQYSHVKYRC